MQKAHKTKHGATLEGPTAEAPPVPNQEENRPRPLLHAGSFWAYTALIALPFLLYVNTLHNNFVFDDLPLIVAHSKVQELSTPWRLFIGQQTGRLSYRAIRTVSYAIDYAIGGMNPTVFHASNITYHALTVLVVFRLVQALTGASRAAFLAALLFATHPIQTDAVAYLSGRRDILSTLFYLTGFLAFIRYRESGRRWRLGAALVAYFLAVLSKEMAITLPLLWLGYDLLRTFEPQTGESFPALLRRLGNGFRRVLMESRLFYLASFGAAGAAACYLLFVVRVSRQKAWYGGSLPMTLLTSSRIVVHYIKLLLFPATLSADYSYNAFPVASSWADVRAWLALLVLALIAIGLGRLSSSSKVAAFGGLWFFVTLLPVSQIIPHHELMAEHYLYLPSVGVALLVGTLLDRWARTPRAGRALAIGVSTALLLLSVRTVARNRDWKDELTLWQTTVRTAPDSARARTNLGLSYLDLGQHQAAEQELKAALAILPNDVHVLNSLGILYISTRREGEAEQAFMEAARVGMERNKGLAAVALNNLGALYLGQKRDREAEAFFRQATETAPTLVKPPIVLGRLYLESGRFEEAERELKRALQLRSDLRAPHLLLAHLYLYRGELDTAEREAQESLRRSRPRLPPGAYYGLIGLIPQEKQAADIASAHAVLAQIHLAAGRLDQAEAEANAAIEGNPSLPAARGVLAQAYAARGQLDQAEAEAKEALRLQQSRPEPSFGGRRQAAEAQPGRAQATLKRDDQANAPYHYILGVIYMRRGKAAAATAEMKATLRLNPRFEAARAALKALGAKSSAR